MTYFDGYDSDDDPYYASYLISDFECVNNHGGSCHIKAQNAHWQAFLITKFGKEYEDVLKENGDEIFMVCLRW